MMEVIIPLVALTAMEVVLGIDNVVFIAILVGRLPESLRAKGRIIGLGLAMAARILLLFSLTWILGLDKSLFELEGFLTSMGLPEDLLPNDVNEVSFHDLILFAGGLFLIGKSVHEIHVKFEDHEEHGNVVGHASFGSVLVQITLLDIIFSLDSVITAVGMVDKDKLWVMVTAVVLAIILMMVFSGKVSQFVDRHPTAKMLSLSFLILIGVMLVAEGIGTHINKGYIYFAMAFSLVVEFLNMKVRARLRPAAATSDSS